MRAIVTVVGSDRVGIIAEVCTLLANMDINIIDISQTVMDEFFTMIMLTDTKNSRQNFDGITQALDKQANDMKLSIHIQREDLFESMNNI